MDGDFYIPTGHYFYFLNICTYFHLHDRYLHRPLYTEVYGPLYTEVYGTSCDNFIVEMINVFCLLISVQTNNVCQYPGTTTPPPSPWQLPRYTVGPPVKHTQSPGGGSCPSAAVSRSAPCRSLLQRQMAGRSPCSVPPPTGRLVTIPCAAQPAPVLATTWSGERPRPARRLSHVQLSSLTTSCSVVFSL